MLVVWSPLPRRSAMTLKNVLLVILIPTLSLGIGFLVSWALEQDQRKLRERPCETFRDWSAKDVPVRCVKYFNGAP